MAVGHGGLYHSQSPEATFLQASGLKVGFAKGRCPDANPRMTFVLRTWIPTGGRPPLPNPNQRPPPRRHPRPKPSHLHRAQNPLPRRRRTSPRRRLHPPLIKSRSFKARQRHHHRRLRPTTLRPRKRRSNGRGRHARSFMRNHRSPYDRAL